MFSTGLEHILHLVVPGRSPPSVLAEEVTPPVGDEGEGLRVAPAVFVPGIKTISSNEDCQSQGLVICIPLLSVSFGFVFFAIDFFNLTPPVGFSFFASFFGNNLVAGVESAKLISELEATEAGVSMSATVCYRGDIASIRLTSTAGFSGSHTAARSP